MSVDSTLQIFCQVGIKIRIQWYVFSTLYPSLFELSKRHYFKNHTELDTQSDHFKANTAPIRNVNFDYNFMDQLGHPIDQWDPSCELKCNKFLDNILNAQMTVEELSLAIRKAKTGKASGLDLIPVEFYKNGGAIIQNSILAVFNFMHQSGDYPQIWADEIINSIYKDRMGSRKF